jgi:hypothetical protein
LFFVSATPAARPLRRTPSHHIRDVVDEGCRSQRPAAVAGASYLREQLLGQVFQE